ncbi:MAG: class I SAM-dependent methyltransferase [Anaerolineaceae bacterium]|nr:class I SAM-dependent methyltransferase [Anaerolineaceae bacterium]
MADYQDELAARWRELAQPEASWHVLEVTTRGCIVTSSGVSTTLSVTDPTALPLAENRFDLVTCRNAVSGFPDSYRFMLEMRRVLKPGGILLVKDVLLPDGERAAGYVNAFLKLRDPRHIRAYADYEWEGTALDAGFEVALVERFTHDVPLLDPNAEEPYTPYRVERLHILLRQAPQAAAAWLQPHCPGTADARFTQHTIILKAVKPV